MWRYFGGWGIFGARAVLQGRLQGELGKAQTDSAQMGYRV